MIFKLEVIGFTIEGCIIAQEAGANRIELCDNPAAGGTTPSYGFLKAARAKLQTELYSMIRPRGGNFLYSDEDFEIMKSEVRLCKELGCEGIVTGILTADGKIDKERCSILVDMAYPLGVTFHRAFDRTKDPFEELENIISIGFERILTSGQQPTAPQGIKTITKLIKQADDRIIIMPGSGIKSENIINLAEVTGAVEFHTSARIFKKDSMEYRNEALTDDENVVVSVDGEEVKKIINLLNNRH